MKLTKYEVYSSFFIRWFEKYAREKGLDLFLAGNRANLVGSLLWSPRVLGSKVFEPQWEIICKNLLLINPYDEESREELINSVIKFATDTTELTEYTYITNAGNSIISKTFYEY